MTFDKANALEEVRCKSLDQIQVETARTWALRAWAARRLGYALEAAEFAHEAVEHAALADPAGGLLQEVWATINSDSDE